MTRLNEVLDNQSDGKPFLAMNLTPYFAETGALFRIAAPLILASLITMGVSITDVVMMGWLGPTELAAGAAASDFYSIIYYFAAGIVAAVSPIVSQALGGGRDAEVKSATQQGFWIAALLSIPGGIIVWHADVALSLIGVQQDIVTTAVPYTQMMAFTFAPMLAAMVWHYFLSAHDLTRVILYVTAVILPVNALGNYAFMFGHFGFPPLGLAGAGLSSALCAVLMFTLLSLYSLLTTRLKPYRLLSGLLRPNWGQFREIFRIGTPIGIANFGELGVFMLSTLMMGVIGAEALAAHTVALRMAGVFYALPLGLAQAATIRIGYAVGANNKKNATLAMRTGLLLGLIVGIFFLIFVWAMNHGIAALFLDPSAASVRVFAQAALFLTILALVQPFDCCSTLASGILRGYKDTRIPMLITLFGFWGVGFVGAMVLAFGLKMNGLGIWIGLAAATAVVAVGMLLRLSWFSRRNATRDEAFT